MALAIRAHYGRQQSPQQSSRRLKIAQYAITLPFGNKPWQPFVDADFSSRLA
jgi:hypothetical protein